MRFMLIYFIEWEADDLFPLQVFQHRSVLQTFYMQHIHLYWARNTGENLYKLKSKDQKLRSVIQLYISFQLWTVTNPVQIKSNLLSSKLIFLPSCSLPQSTQSLHGIFLRGMSFSSASDMLSIYNLASS